MSAPSVRTVTVAAMFGLLSPGGRVGGATPAARGAARMAARLDAALSAGGVAMVRGASGSGKSLIVAALEARARAGGGAVRLPEVEEARGGATPVDLIDLPLSAAMRLLARAGLADARALVRPTRELSEGERWRLRLALAMRRCEQRAAAAPEGPASLLVIDEFCALLDRTSARSVSHTLARWVRASARVRAVCATAHDDLRAALAPEVVISCELGRLPRMERVGGARAAQ